MMKKVIRISVFLFPWEIDQLQDVVDRLKVAATFVDKDKYSIVLDVTLNVSVEAVNWQKSKVDEQFFINSFTNICKKASYFFEVDSNVDHTTKIFGCVDKRRESIKKSNDSDYIVWLDLDVYFPTHILHIMTTSLELADTDLFIITPQTVKLWDNSWDILTNERYINDHPKLRKQPGNEIFNSEKINFTEFVGGNIYMTTIPSFKFGGGWFNLFSAKLLKLIGIPESFGSYGLEDTYVTAVCNACQQLNYPIIQYVLKNVVVGEQQYEEHGINFNFKSLLDISLPSKEVQLQQSQQNFSIELEKKLQQLSSYVR